VVPPSRTTSASLWTITFDNRQGDPGLGFLSHDALRLASRPALEALGYPPKTAGCPFEPSRERSASLLDETREPQPPGQANKSCAVGLGRGMPRVQFVSLPACTTSASAP
jgi:hypothetical protein